MIVPDRLRSSLGLSLVLGLGLAAACSLVPQRADITAAETGADDREVILSVNSCNADLSADVDEGPEEVVITVTSRNRSRDDCADGLVVELAEPLGDRAVIDGKDDQELFVSGRR